MCLDVAHSFFCFIDVCFLHASEDPARQKQQRETEEFCEYYYPYIRYVIFCIQTHLAHALIHWSGQSVLQLNEQIPGSAV